MLPPPWRSTRQRTACGVTRWSWSPPAGWRQTPLGAALTLGLAAALAEHLAGVPWLAKDLVWLVQDARCGLLPSVEVRP